MSASPEAVLRLEGVSKRFASPGGPVHVLRNLNLRIEAGEFIAITGPSGSGKTTLLNIAGLLDWPTEGHVFLDGVRVAPEDAESARRLRAERLGMVFQRFFLLPHRSVLDNVLFRFRYVRHDPATARARAMDLLDGFGMAHAATRPARVLSAGEMQRVALARALVLEPRLLLADEPTGNLDRASTTLIMDHLARLHRRGLTILMVTHNDALLHACTRHWRCADGQLEAVA